ncbi:hypothetical protein D9611_001389 [Ephemerocybe angulata]|uniref:Telomeric single stranded DNA binding POT1/Cdc13 domain-containing protein n=1 Tax=Ephemerocybe angulata TaxID=980116 RepID=A0A8H5CII4_9AGAR|nr:hypothetical protein D9611_001389 [Tulosesus angulatus]
MKRPSSCTVAENDPKRMKYAEAVTEKIDQLVDAEASIIHAQDLEVDVMRPPYSFISMNTLSRNYGSVNVIGIVLESEYRARATRGTMGILVSCTHPDLQLTLSTDWKLSIRIGDANTRPGERECVNLFAKNEADLPNPSIGDIIILKGVKDKEYQSAPQLVGSSGAYTWDIVSRKPCTEPFKPAEEDFCLWLLDWDSENKDTEAVSEILGVEVVKPVPEGRVHTLFNGIQASLAGRGFIDDTVEVHWTTDYTRNPEWESRNSNFNKFYDWCPPAEAVPVPH